MYLYLLGYFLSELRRINGKDEREERPIIKNWTKPIVNKDKDIKTPNRPKKQISKTKGIFIYNLNNIHSN